MKEKSKKVAIMGILIALAMIFAYIEAMIPMPIALPGIKLGIANIVIVVTMYMIDFKTSAFVNIVRVILIGLMFTGAFSILYSIFGSFLSLIIMGLLRKSEKFSIIGVSMAGGVFHNVGQLITASMILTSTSVFVYFPVLLFSGMITGIIVGLISREVFMRLDKIYKP